MTIFKTSTGNVFLLDPSHRQFIEGKTNRLRSRVRDWIDVILVLLIVFFGGYIFGAGRLVDAIHSQHNLDLLVEQGVNTQGAISQVEYQHDSEANHTDAFVTYSFTVKGTEYSGISIVEPTLYPDLNIGSRIGVRYQIDNPSNTLPISQINAQYGNIKSSILYSTLFIIGTLGALYYFYNKHIRLNTLEQKGRLIEGVLVDSSGLEDDNGAYIVTLTYKIHNEDGVELEETASNTRNDLKNKLPARGTKLIIVYVNDNLLKVL
jgi:hypothetical protein